MKLTKEGLHVSGVYLNKANVLLVGVRNSKFHYVKTVISRFVIKRVFRYPVFSYFEAENN